MQNITALPEIVCDLSRLLSRVLHPTPTGVDRCEMAYARGLLKLVPNRLSFAAVHPLMGYGRLPTPIVQRFLDETERFWQEDSSVGARISRAAAVRKLWKLRPRKIPTKRDRFFIQASPNNLTDPSIIRNIKRQEQARFICLVHDLIPIEFPEYARPGGAVLHKKRMTTLAQLADGILVNSRATLNSLQSHLAPDGGLPPVAVAHLGTDIVPRSDWQAGHRPYFVCVGTIEPRKNHLLLLHIWRALAEAHGAKNIPRLLVIGRRGWENEQVVDLLERCPALSDCVEEFHGLSDRDMQAAIAGARALLLPSFAEGYGMPVSEALALKTPVVCSDLPALREAGGNVPLFLDPLDGRAWMNALHDLSSDQSTIAADQRERMHNWRAPTWDDHLEILLKMLHDMPL